MTTADTDLVTQAVRAPGWVSVRRRLFRQLLESLVYERAVEVSAGTGGELVVAGVDAHGSGVRYRFTARRRHSFGRVTIGPSPVLREPDGQAPAEADSLTRFLAETASSLTADPECLARFARELEETLVKDALAQHVRARRRDVLRGADYDRLEWMLTDGHRYHPAYKSRIGFDLADDLAYGPEFGEPVRPLWLAAHRRISRVAVSHTVTAEGFLRRHLGDGALAVFRRRIRDAGGDPAEFTLLPAHPWQWREQLARGFAAYLREGTLIPLGADPETFRPQQSIRTLSCRETPQRPSVKLALSIVNTSTSRVLAPHTVGNAPAVSDWLHGLVADDAFLRDECRLILLSEVMGTVVDPEPPAEAARADTYGTLACIWRESLHRWLDPGEQAVPFTGLVARELDGTPLVDDWVRASGTRTWVRQLTRAAVIPLLHLLVRHGVACEAHAQNLVLVVDGVPARVAVKDFHDGVRFSRSHLAEPERCPALAAPPAHHVNANSFLETDDPAQVTDFLLDALCFVNLAELAMLLADDYALDERVFWGCVRGEIRRHQRRFAAFGDRFALFDVLKPTVSVEKLTTRRLLPDTAPRLHPAPNPLADPER